MSFRNLLASVEKTKIAIFRTKSKDSRKNPIFAADIYPNP